MKMARRKGKGKMDFNVLKIASVSNSISCKESIIITTVFIHKKMCLLLDNYMVFLIKEWDKRVVLISLGLMNHLDKR